MKDDDFPLTTTLTSKDKLDGYRDTQSFVIENVNVNGDNEYDHELQNIVDSGQQSLVNK